MRTGSAGSLFSARARPSVRWVPSSPVYRSRILTYKNGCSSEGVGAPKLPARAPQRSFQVADLLHIKAGSCLMIV